MLITWFNINFYSENLSLIKSLSTHTIDSCIQNIDCCYKDTSEGFIISCNVEQEKVNQLANVYEGSNLPEDCSWVFKAVLDKELLKLRLQSN